MSDNPTGRHRAQAFPRYELKWNGGRPDFFATEDGRWVRYEDAVAALAAAEAADAPPDTLQVIYTEGTSAEAPPTEALRQSRDYWKGMVEERTAAVTAALLAQSNAIEAKEAAEDRAAQLEQERDGALLANRLSVQERDEARSRQRELDQNYVHAKAENARLRAALEHTGKCHYGGCTLDMGHMGPHLAAAPLADKPWAPVEQWREEAETNRQAYLKADAECKTYMHALGEMTTRRDEAEVRIARLKAEVATLRRQVRLLSGR